MCNLHASLVRFISEVHDVRYNHYENMPMQYKEIFKVVKNEKFQLKKFDIFLTFATKHRLWVLVRTASARRF